MQRLLCRLLGHDWSIALSHPDWSPVEPVYFIEVDTEMQLVGWTVEWDCRRTGCAAVDVEHYTYVGGTPMRRLRTVVVGHDGLIEWGIDG